MSSPSSVEIRREVSAIKRMLSVKLQTRLKQRRGTVASLARELGTSRTAVQRVLNPKNTSITLQTMVRAANVLGYKVSFTMEPRIEKVERVEAPVKVESLLAKLGEAVDRLPSR